MTRLELARTLDKTWDVAPENLQASHWTFVHQNAWFKWGAKQLLAVAMFDERSCKRLLHMARASANEPPARTRRLELVP
jgi:hypothetical protein